jgi:hypothetical protein
MDELCCLAKHQGVSRKRGTTKAARWIKAVGTTRRCRSSQQHYHRCTREPFPTQPLAVCPCDMTTCFPALCIKLRSPEDANTSELRIKMRSGCETPRGTL